MAKKRKQIYSGSLGVYPNQYLNGGGLIGGAVTGVLNGVASGIKNAQIADTSNIQNSIIGAQTDYSHLNSLDGLEQAQPGTLQRVSKNQVKKGNFITDMASSGLSGFALGNMGESAFNSLFKKKPDGSTEPTNAAYGGQLNNQYLLGGLISSGLSMIGNGIGSLIGNHKAAKEARRLNAQAEYIENYNGRGWENQIDNTIDNTNATLLARTNAFGGNLGTKGADFSTGLISIANGNTHENNPYGGVQMGVDPQGTPNLVEQDETVYDNFVFTNRMLVPKEFTKKYKLGGKMTFADASKELSKESEERPNDVISRKGLDATLQALAQTQEQLKAEQQAKEQMAQQMAMQQAIQKNPELAEQVAQEQAMQEQVNQEQMMQEQMAQQNMMQNPYGQEGYAYGGNMFVRGGTVNGIIEGENDYMDKFLLNQQLHPTTLPSYILNPNIPLNEINNEITTARKQGFKSPYAKQQNKYKINNHLYESDGNLPTWMRYVPTLGAAIGFASNLFQKPDYTDINELRAAANSVANYDKVSWRPNGDYLTYDPLDRQHQTNILNASAGANRRSIINLSGNNRGNAIAGLLASDFNALRSLGESFRAGQESNRAQLERVMAFNRDTNKFNSEGFLKADMANQAARTNANQLYLSGIGQALTLKNNTDNNRKTAINANLTNFFDSIGDIGRENYAMNQMDVLLNSDYFGTLHSKPAWWSNSRWDNYKKERKDYENNQIKKVEEENKTLKKTIEDLKKQQQK